MREIYDEMYNYDFTVRCKETFEKEVILEDEDGNTLDLRGKSAAAQVRPSPNSETLTAEMSCTVDTNNASITFRLTSAQTEAITPGKYAWDLCLIENTKGEEIRKYLIGGMFTVLASVTQ